MLTLCSVASAQEGGWQPSYTDAKAQAEKEHVPLLLHFGAWYCGPCQQMERSVFPDAEVQNALTAGVTAVKIDVSHDSELAQRFGATSVPRDVVLFQDGTTETLNVGRMSKHDYINLIRSVAARGSRITRPDAEPKSSVEPNPLVVKSDASSEVISTIPATSMEPPLLGLEGYCPVRLKTKREWIAGNASISAEYRGILYHFASESERDDFNSNPALYAPQDLGCDPVVLTEDRKAVAGSIRFGAFFDNRLYLFSSTDNRDEFKLNPLKYSRVRSALRADQIEGTRFE
jgi:YHS domain-containing protein/thioredoxin-related protein